MGLLCTFKVVINAFREANEYTIYAYVKIKTDYLYKVNVIIRQNSGGKKYEKRIIVNGHNGCNDVIYGGMWQYQPDG